MSKLRSKIFIVKSQNKRPYCSSLNEQQMRKNLSHRSARIKIQSNKKIQKINLPQSQRASRYKQQNIKDRLYHKNYGRYREIFDDHSNTDALPFILSLRQIQTQGKKNRSSLTQLQPFQVAQKPTHNQITKKKINSIDASASRIRQSSFLLLQKSGYGTKISCQFQSNLRNSNEYSNQKIQKSFINIIKPIKFSKLQRKRYKLKDIICQHQKRLFDLQQYQEQKQQQKE